MENQLILNVKIESSESEIESISKIEKLLYFIIVKHLNKIPIEYLKNNDIKLNKYGVYITYNIYTEKLQFNSNKDNYYLNNIRHILLKYNINQVIEYILIELEKYIINYYDYIKNNEQLINDLTLIYL